MDPELSALLGEAGPRLGLDGDEVQTTSFAGDGSDRRFFRVRSGSSSFIALLSPRRIATGVDENDSYCRIGELLQSQGIPVPRFFWADAERGRFLLEDLGDIHLQTLVKRPGRTPVPAYRWVLRLLSTLHRRVPKVFQPDFCFDTTVYDAPFVYERELEYFRKSFLTGYLKLDVSAEELRNDFERLAEEAGIRRPSHVIHRDFQSRNIMVHRGAVRLIDFQGMRYGPPLYDLASLLLDPYVGLDDREQEYLAELYRSEARPFLGLSNREFRNSYSAVRLCRNLQILGAYGFLGVVKGKRGFFRYIPRAWRSLRDWLRGPARGRYPQMEKWIAVVERFKKEEISIRAYR